MAEITPAGSADKSDAPKNKLVRDSFTIPKAEYAVLNELKQRATRLTQPAKKSELLRAGIELLKGLSDAAFLAALAAVPNLKTGRPPKEDEAEGEKVKRHVKDKTAPKAKAGANGSAVPAAKPDRAAARAARVAAKPQKVARADKPAKAARPITPEKQAAKAAKQAAKGRSAT